MEQEIASKEKTIEELRRQMGDLQESLTKAMEKYRRCEADLAHTQNSCRSHLQELEKYRSEKRELELLNDDWERSKR